MSDETIICPVCRENQNLEGWPDPACSICEGSGKLERWRPNIIVEESAIYDDWTPITNESHFPRDGRWLVTLQNKDGKRKVTVLNWNQLWAGQKTVAYMPLPQPYQGGTE